MSTRDKTKLIQKIVELIEENSESWIKAAFYSDPQVQQVLEELYKRWENSNMSGLPLDYASLNEAELLYNKARHYSSLSPIEAQRIVLQRQFEKQM